MCESFPVVREGRLAQAVDSAGAVRVATYEQGRAIADFILQDTRQFDDVVNRVVQAFNEHPRKPGGYEAFGLLRESEPRFLQQYEFQHGPDAPTKEVISGDDPEPRATTSLRRSGMYSETPPIIDFAEQVVTFDNLDVIFRIGITVCLNDDVLGFKLRDDDEVCSKLWVRALLARFDGEKAIDVQPDTIRHFLEAASVLAENMLVEAAKAYEHAFSEVIAEPITIRLAQKIDVASVATDSEDFRALLEYLSAGGTAEQFFKEHPADERLLRLSKFASDWIGVEKTHPGEPFWTNSDDCKLIRLNEPHQYEGLYVMKLNDKEARFIGIAHYPLTMARESVRKFVANAKQYVQPSNHTSTLLIRNFARAF